MNNNINKTAIVKILTTRFAINISIPNAYIAIKVENTNILES